MSKVKQHTPHGRDRRPTAQSRWHSARTRRRFGKGAGYYSTTANVWKPTNSRRSGLGTGGYERSVVVDG